MTYSPSKKIGVFLLLTLVFSAILYYFIISSGSIQTYALGLMWCPGVAALLTQLIFHRGLRGLGWRPGPVKYLLASYGVPLAYCVIAYGLVWLTGLGRFAPDELARTVAAQVNVQVGSPFIFVAVYVLIMATLGLVLNCFAALGEEIGWRGLLVPELAKVTSFTRVAFISGLIWAAWHSPAVLFADYHNAGAPKWFGLICFTVLVTGMSFVFAWLRLRSGSVWTAVILHASHNLFVQAVFTPLTADTGLTPYMIDEFGAALALAALVLAYVVWRRRADLPPV
jgi:membrane protease YdiL (CAAX protease family)